MKAIIKLFSPWLSKILRNGKYRGLLIIGSLLYLISPIDISPDVLPILGWVDDGMVIAFLVSELSEAILKYRNQGQEIEEDDVIEVKTV